MPFLMKEIKENHSYQPEKERRFVGVVTEIAGIPGSPFSKASLDGDSSVMLMPGSDQITKGDKLRIVKYSSPVHPDDSWKLRIIRNKKSVVGVCIISKCQIIPNKQWDETAKLLIERSKKSESLRHKNWWNKYYESQKPKKEFNPNWFEDLKRAASLGIINGDLD
jgi:hypothetical protein